MKGSLCFSISLMLAGCVASSPPRPLLEIDHRVERETPPDPEVGRLLAQDSLSEQEFLRLVELNHPKFRALPRDVEAAVARELQAGLLPNPTLFSGLEEAPTSRLGDGKWTIGLRYPLIISGRIGAGARAAERERQMIESLIEVRRRELLRDVRRDLYEYLYAREAARLEEENRVLTKEFYEIVRERREAKVVLELELLRARVESVSQEIESDGTTRDREKASARLKAWTGVTDFDPARIKVDLPFDYAVPDLKATEHPLLQASARNVELADALLDAAEREAIPDLELLLAYGHATASDEREDILEAGVEIPLPIFNRNQGRIAELEVLRRKAILAHQETRLDFLARSRVAQLHLDQQRLRTSRYRDAILPDAAAAVKEAADLYKEKKILGLEMLDTQRVLVKARRSLLDARRDLALAIADLEFFTGGRP